MWGPGREKGCGFRPPSCSDVSRILCLCGFTHPALPRPISRSCDLPFPGAQCGDGSRLPGEAAAHRPAPGRFHPPRAHVAVRLSGTKPADGLRPVPGRRVLAHRSRQALVTAAVNIHLSPTPRLPVSFTVILCWCFRGPGPPTCGPAQNRTFT